VSEAPVGAGLLYGRVAVSYGWASHTEATLIAALAAIAFALPVLRNAMPGSPPLVISADMWVFLWTELAVVLALVLTVFKWAKLKSQPLRSAATAATTSAWGKQADKSPG
jgi:hypothetical protein